MTANVKTLKSHFSDLIDEALRSPPDRFTLEQQAVFYFFISLILNWSLQIYTFIVRNIRKAVKKKICISSFTRLCEGLCAASELLLVNDVQLDCIKPLPRLQDGSLARVRV